MTNRRGRGFKSRHPDDEHVDELARMTCEEGGAAGHRAEWLPNFAATPSAGGRQTHEIRDHVLVRCPTDKDAAFGQRHDPV